MVNGKKILKGIPKEGTGECSNSHGQFTLLAEQSAGPADLMLEGRHSALGVTLVSLFLPLLPHRTSYFNSLKKTNKQSCSKLPLSDSLTGLRSLLLYVMDSGKDEVDSTYLPLLFEPVRLLS